MELSNEAIFAIERFLSLFLNAPFWTYAAAGTLVVLVFYMWRKRRLKAPTSVGEQEAETPRRLTVTIEHRNKRGKVKRRRTSVILDDSLLKELGGLLKKDRRPDAIEVACRRLRIKRPVATKLIENLETK